MEGNEGMDTNPKISVSGSHSLMSASARRATIVDVHTHLWESTSQLGPSAAKSLRDGMEQPWQRADVSMTHFSEAMQTVSYAMILGFESQHLDASINAQQVANYVATDPSRYLGLAGIDPLSNDALEDLDRAIDLGLVGVVISPTAQDFHPCHTRAMRVYERCEQAGLPILIHPGTHWGAATNLEYAQPHLFDEPARSFPNLRWVLGQIGYPWLEQALMLIGKHPHMYADVSHLSRQPWLLYNTLVRAHESGAIDKILFGSDFPFNTPEEAIVAIYSINTLTQGTLLPTIPREQLRGIVERDALSCLGITPPQRQADADTQGEAHKVNPGHSLSPHVTGEKLLNETHSVAVSVET